MAVTVSVLFTPYQVEPVNTYGMWYGLTSASATTNDFKYTFNVYYNTNTSYNGGTANSKSSIGTFKVAPDPVNLNGIFTPHRALKSKMTNRLYYGVIVGTAPLSGSYSYNPNSTLLHTDNAALKYSIDYGFEHNPNLNFLRVKQVSPFSNYVIEFNTAPGLTANDIITISKTNPQLNTTLNGVHQVITMISATQAQLNGIPTGTLFTDTGRITYLKRVIHSITQSTLDGGSLYAIDSIRSMTQSYDVNVVRRIVNGSDFALTSLKNRTIGLNQYDSVTFIANTKSVNETLTNITVQLINSDGNTYGDSYTFSSYMSNYASTYPDNIMWQVAVGTNEISTAINQDLSNVYGYKINLYFNAGSNHESIYRYIDNNCSIYDTIRIAFLNKWGGWDFISFNKANKKKSTITRTEIKRTLPFDNNITNHKGKRQSNYLSINSDERITINSDWMTEDEYRLVEELVESPEVYKIDGLDYSTVNDSIINTHSPIPKLTPIMITSTSYETKTILNDVLFNCQLEYKMAFEKITHNR